MTSSASPRETPESALPKEGRVDDRPDESISIDKEPTEPIKPASLSSYLVSWPVLQVRGHSEYADKQRREFSPMARGTVASLP